VVPQAMVDIGSAKKATMAKGTSFLRIIGFSLKLKDDVKIILA
jgi:hypothetical protein